VASSPTPACCSLQGLPGGVQGVNLLQAAETPLGQSYDNTLRLFGPRVAARQFHRACLDECAPAAAAQSTANFDDFDLKKAAGRAQGRPLADDERSATLRLGAVPACLPTARLCHTECHV